MSLPPTFKNTETPPSPDSLSSPLPSSPLSVSLSPSFFIHLHSTYHLTHYEFYLFAYCFPPPLDYKFQEEIRVFSSPINARRREERLHVDMVATDYSGLSTFWAHNIFYFLPPHHWLESGDKIGPGSMRKSGVMSRLKHLIVGVRPSRAFWSNNAQWLLR